MPLIPAALVPTYKTVDLRILRVDIERVHSWSSYSVTLYTSLTVYHRYPHSPGPRRSSSGPGWRTPRWRGRGPLRAHRGGQPCTCRGQGVRRYTAGDRGQEIHSREQGVLRLTSSGSSRPLRPSILLTGYHTLTTAVALILEYQSVKVLREDINSKVDL